MLTSGQTETDSVRFRPVSVSVSVFRFSTFSVFWPILAAHFSKKSTAKTAFYGGNKVFRPKQAILVSAEISAFPGGLVSVSLFWPKICFV